MKTNPLVQYLMPGDRKLSRRIKKAINKLNQQTPFCKIEKFSLKKRIFTVIFNKGMCKEYKTTLYCNEFLFKFGKDRIKLFTESESNPIPTTDPIILIKTTKLMDTDETRDFLRKFCDYVLKNQRK